MRAISGSINGSAHLSQFNNPMSMCLSVDERFLFVADSFNQSIRIIDNQIRKGKKQSKQTK